MSLMSMLITTVIAQPGKPLQEKALGFDHSCCDSLIDPPKSCCNSYPVTTKKAKVVSKTTATPAQKPGNNNAAATSNQGVNATASSGTASKSKKIPQCCFQNPEGDCCKSNDSLLDNKSAKSLDKRPAAATGGNTSKTNVTTDNNKLKDPFNPGSPDDDTRNPFDSTKKVKPAMVQPANNTQTNKNKATMEQQPAQPGANRQQPANNNQNQAGKSKGNKNRQE